MRILFKTPHQVFFRRCFAVKDWRYSKRGSEDVLIVEHGLNRTTVIPVSGTIVRFIGKLVK